MKITQLLLADYMHIFSGNTQNYGLHEYSFNNTKKENGSNKTVTNKLLTITQYKSHLDGEIGLGLIPIMANNKAYFGVIDIDIYKEVHELDTYIKAIENNNFPLIPFRSKSGGLHLYLFFKKPVPAKKVIEVLNKFAQLLGLTLLVKNVTNKMLEVFPKQHILRKNSIGNWINLPYFNAEDTKQYCIKNNKALSIDDAIVYIKQKQQAIEDVVDFIKTLSYNDGPPCLQTLYFLNPFEKNSMRNNYLFSFGIYLKKKDENFFEQKLFEINQQLKKPLISNELEKTILSSLRKKDYTYLCKQEPLSGFCNQALCKKREFGIGKEGGYFSELEYGQLVQIKISEPYYEWEVKLQEDKDYKKLRFKNEDEIIKQDTFLKLCFRELHILPIKLKVTEWSKIINQHLSDIHIIEVAEGDDISPMSIFKALFYDFLLNRAFAKNKTQLLNKRVYFDEDQAVYYFRAKDLLDFIYIQKNFRFFMPTEVHGILHDLKTFPKRIKLVNGKQVRVYGIKEVDIPLDFDFKESEENKVFKADFTRFEEEAF